MALSNILLLVIWVLRVTPDWVKLAAEADALRLLAACDQRANASPASASPKLIVSK